jgi:hypothetical protein
MSYIKFSSNLFIGSLELGQFQQLLTEEGYLKLFLSDAVKFGLFNAASPFTNGQVEQGINAGTIKHGAIVAVNKYGKLILKDATDQISVPDDNQWRWIKIKHQYVSRETGTVSIDAQGNLTGTGTSFLSVLRGNPYIPSRIKFLNSTQNLQEYDVHEVVSDTNALILGSFIPESGLQYSVIGTFSSDAVPSEDQKNIFQYDVERCAIHC